MKTIIVWFRNDLRVHDHPALAMAAHDADMVVPVFILNDELLKSGKHASSNRNRFLLECLEDLRKSLTEQGANLIIRHGDAETELQELIKETAADAIYYTADYTPYAIKRDKAVKAIMDKNNVEFRSFPGRLAVSSLDKLQTKTGMPHKVFTPFYKNWLQVQRRAIAEVPKHLQLPGGFNLGELPKLEDITKPKDLSPNVLRGGETAGRQRLKDFLDQDIKNYKTASNDMAANGTSRLSAYLHFGCLSPAEIETMLAPGTGPNAWRRQLCWREFYHYVIFKFPDNATQEFQERYRNLKWGNDEAQLQAWKDGMTGYPVVDAGMRQLRQEGWMHNRARLIVGSFLTKDLWLDWRLGEQYFMNMLLDGDESNNNGNWQWIASVGVDPAPAFRRLYNPTLQQVNYDPRGEYVRRYVPELKNVPDKYLAEPWMMPGDVQQEAGCVIGSDYPGPIVDHKQARIIALEQYRTAK